MKYLFALALSMLLVLGATAQNMLNVSGKIVDDKNESVVGASVVVKGTSTGVITGASGEYSIQAPANGTLAISFVGMGDKEEVINGRTRIDVAMSEQAEQIDEVVVVGYGVIRKSDITGAVASVKMDDALKSMPVARITDALQGRMAGVSIVNASGAPGSTPTIRVRGINSINGDDGPLVVIDGFIGGDMSSLNPADIASVEVLKDASATAVYGSRGANGVLLVTTKRANKGAPQVTYNGYVNFKTPAKLPDQLSAADNARLQNEYIQELFGGNAALGANPNNQNYISFTDQQIAELETNGGYDYIGETFENVALEQMHEISINGGGEHSRYLISGSFNNNNGIVRNSNAQRANYRVKIDSDIKKWLTIGANVWGSYSKDEGPSFGQYMNLLNRDLSFPRTIPAKDDAGNYNNLTREPNPMRKVNEFKQDGYVYDSWIQGYAEFTILPGLTFRMLGGVTLRNNNSQNASTQQAYESDPAFNRGIKSRASATSTNTHSWLNSNILTYIKEFNANHRINATLVFEQSSNDTYTHTSTAKTLFDDNIAYNNLALAKDYEASSNHTITTLMSALARVNYVLFDRYMITASYRYDGSSRLAKGSQWYGFPSAAVAWDIKKENFMQEVNVMSQAKLRLGYGITGNQAVPAYSAYSKFTQSVDEYGNIGITPVTRANPDLKWESTTQYNGGVDIGFLNNRITASVDVYHKMSEDVILSVTLPPQVGFKDELKNSASILNKGIEVTIGANLIATDKFHWHTDLTLTKNVTTLERIDGIRSYMQLSGNFEETAYRYIVGEKIGMMWGYTNAGIWKSTDGNIPAGLTPGAYKYDEKGAGIIGCGQPTFNWGWNNTLNFYNFDLSLYLIGFHGFDIFNNNDWLSVIDNCVSPNPKWQDRWRPGHEDTDVPGFVENDNDMSISSRKVEKGDFIKIKNITLGYTLPRSILQRAGIANLRVYVSLQNLYTFTSYSGLDPEVTLKNTLTPGADWGYYPNGRNYIAGINFTF